MAVPQVPARGRGGSEASKTFDGPTPRPDTQTPTVAPDQPRPQSEPSAPLQRRREEPPSFLYLVIAGLVLLALLLAWYIYKLRLRLATSGPSDSGGSVSGPSDSGLTDSGPSLFASPSAAQAGAVKGLKDFGLDSREDWKPFLWSGGALMSPLEPVLVQQIDTTHLGEAFYYLVPFGQDLASVTAVACVDGVTGEYQECSRFKSGSGSWGRIVGPWRTAASTRAAVVERKIDLRLDTRTTVRQSEIGVHPQLVWKACKESQSVFLPFRLVKVGDSVRYIRIDGEVYEKLS